MAPVMGAVRRQFKLQPKYMRTGCQNRSYTIDKIGHAAPYILYVNGVYRKFELDLFLAAFDTESINPVHESAP